MLRAQNSTLPTPPLALTFLLPCLLKFPASWGARGDIDEPLMAEHLTAILLPALTSYKSLQAFLQTGVSL